MAERLVTTGEDSGDDRPRRMTGTTRGFATAASVSKVATRTAAARRGIAEARLISQWETVAGPDLARITRPIRMRHRSGDALGGVLVLGVESAHASLVEHQSPQLIERVNAFHGYRAVAEIRLTQAVAGLDQDWSRGRPKPEEAAEARLTSDERARLDSMTDRIEDDALREALGRLGANVIAASKKRPR